jgi:hypothetical protein
MPLFRKEGKSEILKGGYSIHPFLNRAFLIQKSNDSIALCQ